jgi:hypothetical protein
LIRSRRRQALLRGARAGANPSPRLWPRKSQDPVPGPSRRGTGKGPNGLRPIGPLGQFQTWKDCCRRGVSPARHRPHSADATNSVSCFALSTMSMPRSCRSDSAGHPRALGNPIATPPRKWWVEEALNLRRRCRGLLHLQTLHRSV